MMPEIETVRLRLRQFTARDLDELYQIYKNPEVMKYVGKGILTKTKTEAKILAMISHWQKNNFGMWAVVDKSNNKMIGRCGLCFLDNTSEVELGYTALSDVMRYTSSGQDARTTRYSIHGLYVISPKSAVLYIRSIDQVYWHGGLATEASKASLKHFSPE